MGESNQVAGSANGMAKLTEPDIRLIRELYKLNGMTYQKIAEKFDVHFETIRKVVKGRAWTHVTDEEE